MKLSHILPDGRRWRRKAEAEDAERTRQIERGRAIIGAWADTYAEAAS